MNIFKYGYILITNYFDACSIAVQRCVLVKKLRWIPVIIALTLMLSGFAYAGWTEKIQLNFSTKTAFMEFVVLEVHENGLDVDDSVSKGSLLSGPKKLCRARRCPPTLYM